jgi:hypothetical protein
MVVMPLSDAEINLIDAKNLLRVLSGMHIAAARFPQIIRLTTESYGDGYTVISLAHPERQVAVRAVYELEEFTCEVSFDPTHMHFHSEDMDDQFYRGGFDWCGVGFEVLLRGIFNDEVVFVDSRSAGGEWQFSALLSVKPLPEEEPIIADKVFTHFIHPRSMICIYSWSGKLDARLEVQLPVGREFTYDELLRYTEAASK